MPDKKLTDKEIVKALECCIKSTHFGECFKNKCPCVSENGCELFAETLYPYALDLINRLQARVDDLERNDLPRCKDALRRANENGIELQAEVERLQEAIDEQDIEISRLYKRIDEAKAEAYKEFADRLDKEFSGVGTCNYGCVHHKTRKVLKEMVGEDK